MDFVKELTDNLLKDVKKLSKKKLPKKKRCDTSDAVIPKDLEHCVDVEEEKNKRKKEKDAKVKLANTTLNLAKDSALKNGEVKTEEFACTKALTDALTSLNGQVQIINDKKKSLENNYGLYISNLISNTLTFRFKAIQIGINTFDQVNQLIETLILNVNDRASDESVQFFDRYSNYYNSSMNFFTNQTSDRSKSYQSAIDDLFNSIRIYNLTPTYQEVYHDTYFDEGLVKNLYKINYNFDNISEDDSKDFFNVRSQKLIALNNAFLDTLNNALNNVPGFTQGMETIDTPTLISQLKILKEAITSDLNNIIQFLNYANPSYSVKEITSLMKDLTYCGGKKMLSDQRLKEINDTDFKNFAKNSQNSQFNDKDNNNRGFSSHKESDLSKIDYWFEFCKVLNLQGLLPIYWTTGLIITNPIKLPIIWIPIIPINTPVGLFVIWITINGVVVAPTIYNLRFMPIGDADSYHLLLFRGGNAFIKTKTGSKAVGLPIVNGIDINPDLSKTIPFVQDDLPIIERLQITNPPFLLFLNSWLNSCLPYMGLPS
jgi:hypothetical protein